MTRLEDALAAADAGADAIGMVLHANVPRKISLELARNIVDSLPPFVTPVGLFVDAPVELILKITDELNIRHVQLHGNESPDILSKLPGRTIIKAVKVTRQTIERDLAPWRNVPHLSAILLESGDTHHVGGSGVENDWHAIRDAQNAGQFAELPPIIAAGGLKPETVAEVVKTIHPYAVDVSSGIESAPRMKSKEKMEAFLLAVRSADAT